MSLTLQLDPNADAPAYRQLADQLHFAINLGQLAPGQRLPSLRKLAKSQGLAINTVAHAYRKLEARGLIEAIDRSGYRVCARAPEDRYARRGVSSEKSQVHAAIDKHDRGLFPGAFCKVTEDYLGGDPARCNVLHADGAGTKALVAYLRYREHGDASVFRGIAQDSVVMNLDDLLCVGVSGRVVVSSTINRHAGRVGAEVLEALIDGTEAYLAELRAQGVEIYSGGGETADVGDLTPTLVVDTTAVTTLDKREVIGGERLRPGLSIVGLSSSGTARGERAPNSGIGSNGLTSARHDLLCADYGARYPETLDASMDPALCYAGPYRLEDPLPGSSLSVGEALSSPTRSYAPLLMRLLREHRPWVSGLVHCSGGGQTKCLRFGRRLRFVKDQLFEPPPIFDAIQQHSGASAREMYRVFNMGHRMEIYCAAAHVDAICALAAEYGIDARQVGHTETSSGRDNELLLYAKDQCLTYGL
ncbi:MAG: GntR family transcriptional regulator [Myxococcales bacterium]|nr:GntR family transcriptional regulator [Myxococcales bacterium]